VSLRYAEDYKPGDAFDLGEREVTLDEIVEFARKYDPFPFHMDETAARATPFGGIISSGWLTALVWLGMMHNKIFCVETVLGSPGHEEMRWPTPVRAGDRLRGQFVVKESRVSKSKPEIGFVRFQAVLTNQRGEEVFITVATMIIRARFDG
jgi:acyl dehydratase